MAVRPTLYIQTMALRCLRSKVGGAQDGNRTRDLVLTKDVLYRLSYLGVDALERVMGIEPTSSAWKAEVLPLNYTRR
jgi:hypothetical protein